MNKKLAKISSAKLDIKERGILTFWIAVDYEDGWSQYVGGIALDDPSMDRGLRVGTAFGCEVIRRLLLALDVNDFSEMKGKYIYVIGEGEGLKFATKGIQALRVDKSPYSEPIIFSDILEEFK